MVAFSSIGDGAQEALSTNAKDAICFDRLIFASSLGGLGGGQTKTFLNNGTIWEDGVCETCRYETGLGNFNCVCEENRTIIEDSIIDAGHNVTIEGIGNIKITGNISGWDNFEIRGNGTDQRCVVELLDGGSVK